MTGRVCSSCKVWKPFNEFNKSSSGPYGYKSNCKSCRNKQKQLRRTKKRGYAKINPVGVQMFKVCSMCGLVKSYNKFPKNKSMNDGLSCYCFSCFKDIHVQHREQNKARCKSYKKKNKEKIQAYNKKYKRNNASYIKQYRRNYYIQNKKCEMQYYNKYSKRRKKEDSLYYLACKLRQRTSQMFSMIKLDKQANTEELLGADYFTVKQYIEGQFDERMNWSNAGSEWHLDHIVPLSSAKDEKEMIRLAHYTNLQPLWASDNIIKSNKFPEGHQLRCL